MELLKSREGKGGVWLADKVLLNEGNVKRGSDLGEWKTSQGFQVTESQLSTIQANEATTGESLARVTPSGDSLIYYTDGLTQDTFKICKEFLRPFKKCLRRLNPPKDLSQEKRLSCTRKNLTILGDHINMFLQHYCKTWELKHWKKMLWRFVALFSALDEKQLCKLYRYSKTNQDSKFLALRTADFSQYHEKMAARVVLLKEKSRRNQTTLRNSKEQGHCVCISSLLPKPRASSIKDQSFIPSAFLGPVPKTGCATGTACQEEYLKTFHLMECPDLVALPENHNLLKLRDSWGLCGDVKVQDRLSQVCSQAPGGDLPAGKSIRKRPYKASLRTKKEEGANRQRLKKIHNG